MYHKVTYLDAEQVLPQRQRQSLEQPQGQGHVLSILIHSHYQWGQYAEPSSCWLQSEIFRHGNDTGKWLPAGQYPNHFKWPHLKFNLSAVIKNKTFIYERCPCGTRPRLGVPLRYPQYLPQLASICRFFTPADKGSFLLSLSNSGCRLDWCARFVVWAAQQINWRVLFLGLFSFAFWAGCLYLCTPFCPLIAVINLNSSSK